MRMRIGLLAITGVMLNGCYTYIRSSEPAAVNTSVEVTLSTEAQIRLRDRIGLDLRALRGELVADDGTMIMVEIQSSGPLQGMGGGPVFQRIDLARADVLELRIRQLNTGRSLALGGAVAGLTTVLVVSAVTGEKNPGSIPPIGGGPDDRVSQMLPRIPIR